MTTEEKYLTGSALSIKGKKFKVIGARVILEYGQFWTNENIIADLFVKGQRGATYRAFVKKDGTVELNSRYGQQTPHFIGNFGYLGVSGTMVNYPFNK